MNKFTWVMLGASSSIAKAVAHKIAKNGDDVLLLGRDEQDLKHTAADLQIRYNISAKIIEFDFLDINKLAKLPVAILGRSRYPIKLFIAFAMMPPNGEKLDEMLLTNFFVPIKIIEYFLPHLNQNNHIVVIGSVAGDVGRAPNYQYGATKAGIHTYLEGLAKATAIPITEIKPGYIDTQMTYGKVSSVVMVSPKTAARGIMKAIKAKRRLAYVPRFWWGIMKIVRVLRWL